MVLNLKWIRDPAVKCPNIWKTFTGPGPYTDELREFVIKELTIDQFEEAFNLYIQVYIRNEPMAMALGMFRLYMKLILISSRNNLFFSGMINDIDSIEWFKKIAFTSVKQNMGLACFDSVNNKIVGVNLLYVVSKEDKFVDQIRALVSHNQY